jgi:ABC-type transport system involved in multi-copper enzyme maturation permease subunit
MSTGQIYDLGYKRYLGTRRSVDTRWTVIMRHQIATTWKGWWRFKVWLVGAVLVTTVNAVLLYTLGGRTLQRVGGLGGSILAQYIDGLLPDSTIWYGKAGFIVSLAISATVVAGDLQSGAFTFYFARSLRPRDYVVGKLAGLGVMLALILLVGPVVLAGVRLALSDNFDQLIALLPTVYKALAVGALGTLIYAAIPLGFSALIANRRHAMILWAAYYLLVGWMGLALGYVTTPAIAALDLASALHSVSLHLFGLHTTGRTPDPPTSAALISIFGHAALAIGAVVWRVRSAQQTGVGGAS